MKTIVKKPLTEQLIGHKLPPKFKGENGRGLEDLVESFGLPVNRGSGIDCPIIDCEFKARDINSTSPQTVSTITFENVLNMPYEKTSICEKFQKQLRVKTNDDVIVSAEIHDFSPDFIQDKIRTAYETARAELTRRVTYEGVDKDTMPNYIYGTQWGYLERVDKTRNQYHFRVSPGAMDDYEAMSRSTFAKLFY